MPKGPLLAGLSGALLNWGFILVAVWPCVPLVTLSVVSGVLGVLVAAFRPRLSQILLLVGSIPGFLILGSSIVLLPWGCLLLPLGIPTLLMIFGARLVTREVDVAVRTSRCRRCRGALRGDPNIWNRAGFCSRKCLKFAR